MAGFSWEVPETKVLTGGERPAFSWEGGGADGGTNPNAAYLSAAPTRGDPSFRDRNQSAITSEVSRLVEQAAKKKGGPLSPSEEMGLIDRVTSRDRKPPPFYPEGTPDIAQQMGGDPLGPRDIPDIDRRRKAQMSGVSFDNGASTWARATAEMGIDTHGTEGELETVRQAIEADLINEAGGPANMKVEVRRGEMTEEIEYRVLGRDEGWSLFDPANQDVGDWAAVAPHAAQIIPELVGTAIGGTLGSGAGPIGTVGGASFGAALTTFGADLARTTLGISRGLQMTQDEQWAHAARASAMSAFGTVALPAFVKVAKALGIGVPRELRKVNPADIQRGLDEYREFAEEVYRRTGQKWDPTTGQILSGLEGDAAMAAENRIAAEGLGIGSRLAGQRSAQNVIVNDMAGETFGLATDPTKQAGVGRTVKETISRGPKDRIRAREAEAAAAREQAEQATEVGLGRGAPTSAGLRVEEARGALETTEKKLFRQFNARYDEVYGDIEAAARGSGSHVSIKEYQEMADELARYSLVPQGENIATRTIARAQELASTTSERAAPITKIPWRMVQDSISDFRAVLRDPNLPPKEGAVMRKLMGKLIKQRNQFVRGTSEENWRKLMHLEVDYRNAKTLWERDIVGRVMKEADSSSYTMGENAVVNRLIGNPREMRVFMDAVNNVNIPEAALAKSKMQSAVRSIIKQRFLDDDTYKIVDKKSYKGFLDDHAVQLKELFGRSQYLKMQKAGTASKAFKAADKRAKDLDAFLQSEFRMGVGEWQDGTVLNRLWAADNIEEMQKVTRFLKKDPEAMRDFQAAIMGKIWHEMTIQTPHKGIASRSLDLGKMIKFMVGDSNGSYAGHVKAVFGGPGGKQLMSDLDFLTQAVGKADRTPINNVIDWVRAITTSGDSLSGYARFLRVPFPPLSPKGRGLSALAGVTHDKATRAMADAFADPQKLKTMLSLRRTTTGSARTEAILGEFGASMMTIHYDMGPLLEGAEEGMDSLF